MARIIACLLCLTALTTPTLAQESAPRFAWKAGSGFHYSVNQTSTIRQSVPDPDGGQPRQGQTISTLALLKRWDVVSVDAQGIATLKLTVPAMRMEIVSGTAEPIIYDTSKPSESDPDLTKEMVKFVDATLAEIRVDAQGRLVEVKSSTFGPASRLHADLPFKLVWPEAKPTTPWSRAYQIKLDPPQGAGETYDATQTYTLKGTATGSILTVAMTTALKEQPTVDEQIPLLPMMLEGEIYFDIENGRYHGAKLHVEKELTGHRGEGSKYHYQSTYGESIVKFW